MAGTLTAVYSLLTSGIRVFGGNFADKFGGEKVAIYSLLVLSLGALIITLSESLILSLFAAVIMAVGMGIANAAVFKLVPTYVPQAVGGAAGWVGGLGAFGGFAIPPVMGFIADQMGSIGYVRGFMVFIFLSLACLGVIYALQAKKEAVAPAELN